MTTELKKLNINRVDLVPEGANSAAYITLFKGKEMNPVEYDELLEKMKPEYADVIKNKVDSLTEALAKANEDKAKAEEDKAKAEEDKAKAEEDKAKAEEDKAKAEEALKEKETKREGTVSFDEDERVNKSIEAADPVVREYIERINKQKSAAEEAVKVALAKEKHAEAVAKADDLKAIPVEKSKLIEFIEKSNDSETVDMLTAIAKGIEATVLTEVGKGSDGVFKASSTDAWSKIETKAEPIAKERGITKEAAIAVVIEQEPALYKEYLAGGAN